MYYKNFKKLSSNALIVCYNVIELTILKSTKFMNLQIFQYSKLRYNYWLSMLQSLMSFPEKMFLYFILVIIYILPILQPIIEFIKFSSLTVSCLWYCSVTRGFLYYREYHLIIELMSKMTKFLVKFQIFTSSFWTISLTNRPPPNPPQ